VGALAGRLDKELQQLTLSQCRETRAVWPEMVAASQTTLIDVLRRRPIIAAIVLGFVGDISRFLTRDHFAATTAPHPPKRPPAIRQIYRQSRRGIRQLNHTTHIAAKRTAEVVPKLGSRTATFARLVPVR